MNPLVAIVGLLLISLFFVSIAMGQRRASKDGFQDIQLSVVPDICSTLNSTDCNKTQGCIYSPEAGLCVKKHEVEHFTASAVLAKEIVESMTNYLPDAPNEPVPNGTF